MDKKPAKTSFGKIGILTSLAVLVSAAAILALQAGSDYDMFLDAKASVYAREYNQAVNKYKQLIKQFPNSSYLVDATYWLAYSYEKSGQLEQAIKNYDSLATHFPQSRWADEAEVRTTILASHLVKSGQRDYEKYLFKGVKSRNRQIQLRSIFELAASGTPLAMPYIKQHFDQESDPMTRIQILMAVEESGSPEAVPLLKDIMNHDHDPLMRIQALQALRRIQDPAVYPVIRDFYFNEHNRAIREHAIAMLRQFQAAFAAPLFVDILRQEQNDRFKREALHFLERVDEPNIVNEIFQSIPFQSSTEIKLEVIDRFGSRANELRPPVLENIFENEKNPTVRKQVLQMVQYMGPDGRVAVVKSAINDEDPEIKAYAIQLTNDLEGHQTIHFYNRTIDDPNAIVRYKTVTAMTNKASEELLPLFSHTLQNDPVAQVRLQALEGLAKINSETCVPVLSNVITSDGNVKVRDRALELIDKLGNKSALLSVSNVMLKDPDPTLRFKAIDVALGIGGKEAAPYFKQVVVQEEQESIRDKALQLLYYLDPQMAREAEQELEKKYF